MGTEEDDRPGREERSNLGKSRKDARTITGLLMHEESFQGTYNSLNRGISVCV